MSEIANKLYSNKHIEDVLVGTLIIKKCFFNLRDVLKKL